MCLLYCIYNLNVHLIYTFCTYVGLECKENASLGSNMLLSCTTSDSTISLMNNGNTGQKNCFFCQSIDWQDNGVRSYSTAVELLHLLDGPAVPRLPPLDCRHVWHCCWLLLDCALNQINDQERHFITKPRPDVFISFLRRCHSSLPPRLRSHTCACTETCSSPV